MRPCTSRSAEARTPAAPRLEHPFAAPSPIGAAASRAFLTSHRRPSLSFRSGRTWASRLER
eukprot:8077670-Pyramimonas_sp.AAC.1